MKKLLPFLFYIMTSSLFYAQDVATTPALKKKGTFYFSWGYNKDRFSKSDLYFSDPGTPDPIDKSLNTSYDFTIYDVKATDRPGFEKMLRTDLTIPQYVYRLGYYFNNKNDFGVEINFDHTKYIMKDYQTLHVKGTIHGQIIDQDTLIDPTTFLHFEHSDGANFLMFNFIKRQQLFVSKNKKHLLSGIAKIGAGPVIPRTEVTMFGKNLNNRFHIAGYCMGIETGIRYDAFKHLFVEYTVKGVFANYTNVLVIGEGKAKHHFWTAENILSVGLQFPL